MVHSGIPHRWENGVAKEHGIHWSFKQYDKISCVSNSKQSNVLILKMKHLVVKYCQYLETLLDEILEYLNS